MIDSAGKTGHFKPVEEVAMKLFSKPRKLFPAYLLRLLVLAHYFRTFYKHIVSSRDLSLKFNSKFSLLFQTLSFGLNL